MNENGENAGADQTATVGPTTTPTGVPRSVPKLQGFIGHYRVEGEIGRGGMGVVYRGWDTRLDRPVALKTLLGHAAIDENGLSKFEREARLLAALNHPNIAVIHDIDEVAGVPVMVLEYVDGDTLSDVLARGPMPPADVIRLAHQVASALEAAHARGIIHRDLKPGNIKITPAGLVKVLDFGIARRVERAPDDELTGEAVAVGTPGYMSPEQVLGGEVDGRLDLFALGCVLYECLCGRPAFHGGTAVERACAVLAQEPDWSRIPADTPGVLADLVKQCLQREASGRPQGAGVVRRCLEEVSVGSPAAHVLSALASSLRTAQPRGLQRSRTSFVGRQREMQEIKDIVAESPLVTLTGPGGSGKTRLALQVGFEIERDRERFPDGVALADLSALSDAALVPYHVAAALGIGDEARRLPIDLLCDRLAGKRMVLILDNCEHLRAACADLAAALLDRCGPIRILATSREALRVDGERAYVLSPLAVPSTGAAEPLAAILANEAVRLFVDRARDIRRGFVLGEKDALLAAEICRRLDGIPLAIELAAARVKVLTVAQIAERLGDSLRLLSAPSGSSSRHKTLRAAIDWTYDQLTPPEQAFYRRVGIFAGGFTLDLAEAVCPGGGIEARDVLDLLAQLVDRSVVQAEEGALGFRYRLLEPIRQHAAERLAESGEAGRVQRLHWDAVRRLAEEADAGLSGPQQAYWLTRLAAEHENILKALDDCAATDVVDVETGLAIASKLEHYWEVRGHWRVGRQQIERLLDRAQAASPAIVAKARSTAAGMSYFLGDLVEARRHLEKTLALEKELNDRGGVAVALNNLGSVAMSMGDLPGARAYILECLSIKREIGDKKGIAFSLNNLGNLANMAGDLSAARAYLEESVAIKRELEHTSSLSTSLDNLGIVARLQRDFAASRACAEESLALARELDYKPGIASGLGNLGTLCLDEGNRLKAKEFLLESLGMFEAMGKKSGIMEALALLSRIALDEGAAERAARVLGAAMALRDSGAVAAHDPKAWDAIEVEIRERLGSERFDACFAAGRAMGVPEAISLVKAGD